eukprot:contig_4732_g1020
MPRRTQPFARGTATRCDAADFSHESRPWVHTCRRPLSLHTAPRRRPSGGPVRLGLRGGGWWVCVETRRWCAAWGLAASVLWPACCTSITWLLQPVILPVRWRRSPPCSTDFPISVDVVFPTRRGRCCFRVRERPPFRPLPIFLPPTCSS